jgi:hypothetical protein
MSDVGEQPISEQLDSPSPVMNDGGTGPKILMFSDIEGCQARANDKEPEQSSFLCGAPFYDEIARRLNEDKKLEVAFLGDYFDQGMRVYDSIKGLKKLLEDFNEENGIERVHVILGNRDVNKLRFFYELNMIKSILHLPKGKRWTTWDAYYDKLDPKTGGYRLTGVELVKHTLITSMGANKKVGEKLTGLYSFMPYDKIDTATDEDALKYLKVALGIIQRDESTTDALDVLSFFQKCKLAHVFNGKVLLAHGGGFDSDAFFDDNYVNGFITNIPPPYSKTLEEYRRRLSGTESTDLPSRFKDTVKVQQSVDVYNKLLKTVLTQLQGERNKEETRREPPSSEFILLQALGLKPDREDARYKSLIQSCSQDGCSGKNEDLKYDPRSTKLAKILKDSGITHVSYGHKPVCFPIPLIYQRDTIPNVTFISNDTSNGNRKVTEIGSNTAIGTSVTFKADGTHESAVEVISLNGEKSPAWKYDAMFGPFSSNKLPPTYNESVGNPTTLLFEGKKLSFNNLLKPPASFGQLEYSDNTTAATTTATTTATTAAGGKRRSRHRKQQKSKRGSKYGGSKKTRRSKHKHTKYGRKMRKQ